MSSQPSAKAPVDEELDMILVEMAEACISGNLREAAVAVRKAHARLFAAVASVERQRDDYKKKWERAEYVYRTRR